MTADNQHPREHFDMYGISLSLGEWSYVVDSTDISYVNDWYPYSGRVRLSPDVEFRSWRNEYVLLSPGPQPHLAAATLHIPIRPQGSGMMIVDCVAELDLQADTVRFSPDDLTGRLLEHAQRQARRVLDLLAAERLRQRTPPFPPRPDTASDREIRRQQATAEADSATR